VERAKPFVDIAKLDHRSNCRGNALKIARPHTI
jgi:hypothetical protein